MPSSSEEPSGCSYFSVSGPASGYMASGAASLIEFSLWRICSCMALWELEAICRVPVSRGLSTPFINPMTLGYRRIAMPIAKGFSRGKKSIPSARAICFQTLTAIYQSAAKPPIARPTSISLPERGSISSKSLSSTVLKL
ncbi:hypothetical protein D3C87_1765080 [compost metagenome]